MEQTLTDQPRNCCSSSQKSRIFCIRTQDTEDVENLHPIINESKLKPYHHPVFPQQQETSLTLIAPSQKSTTQEVEKILDSRRRVNELQYLVKWQGQPFEESMWEDRWEVIRGAARLCQEFHRSHPDAFGIPHNSNTREVVQWGRREDVTLWNVGQDADHVILYLE